LISGVDQRFNCNAHIDRVMKDSIYAEQNYEVAAPLFAEHLFSLVERKFHTFVCEDEIMTLSA
jgi:hypothetical protein